MTDNIFRETDFPVSKMIQKQSNFKPKSRDISPEVNLLSKKTYILSKKERSQMLVPPKNDSIHF